MLHASRKPSHKNDVNRISYKAPLHHLRRLGCYASRLIPEPQRHGKFTPRPKPCVLVGYVHDLTRLWRICDPSFRVVRSQLDVIFDEERNAHLSFLHGDKTNIFDLPDETEHVKEIYTGGDRLPLAHVGTSQTGDSHRLSDHDCTDNDSDHNLPDNRRSLPASTGLRSCAPYQEDAPAASRESFVHI
jgi:hypothetical protein